MDKIIANDLSDDAVANIRRNVLYNKIDPATGGVYFGQLLGMADHLTFTLGNAGYRAYKYVPYGPWSEVMPYLIRRAQENSDMLGGVATERSMLWGELKRRIFARS